MDRLRNYDVEFSGLKTGKHSFRFEISEAFFELFDTEREFTNPRLTADVLLDKHSTFLEFTVRTYGVIELMCDITADPFDYDIDSSIKVLVKFGEEYDDSNEEVITIPAGNHAFNVAQLIYEEVMLSVPMKKISPQATEEDFKLVERYSVSEVPEEENYDETTIDPRWAALKNLKNKN